MAKKSFNLHLGGPRYAALGILRKVSGDPQNEIMRGVVDFLSHETSLLSHGYFVSSQQWTYIPSMGGKPRGESHLIGLNFSQRHWPDLEKLAVQRQQGLQTVLRAGLDDLYERMQMIRAGESFTLVGPNGAQPLEYGTSLMPVVLRYANPNQALEGIPSMFDLGMRQWP